MSYTLNYGVNNVKKCVLKSEVCKNNREYSNKKARKTCHAVTQWQVILYYTI